MNLATKIYKFKRAVWEYRGRYNVRDKKWTVPPKPKTKKRVEKGLERLGLNVAQGMAKVDAFKDGSELAAWLVSIREEKEGEQQ
jgi:hypothetical protein